MPWRVPLTVQGEGCARLHPLRTRVQIGTRVSGCPQGRHSQWSSHCRPRSVGAHRRRRLQAGPEAECRGIKTPLRIPGGRFKVSWPGRPAAPPHPRLWGG